MTQKQVYAFWSQLHERDWRLHGDQTESALKVLKTYEGLETETIQIDKEDGIEAIAFAFRGALDSYGREVTEVAMDSTCSRSSD